MAQRRPLIGVTPWYDYEKRTTYIRPGYCEGINKVGGLAMLLPLTMEDDILNEAIDRCDGFLLSGGSDVDPKYYGELNLPFNEEISPHRDYLEIYITKKAIAQNKPILGICRGIQIMNVALGGTLYQDIHSQVKDIVLLKHSQEAPRWYPTHEVYIEKDSKIYSCIQKECLGVNSFHHQAVKDIAPRFKVTSRAADGIIESIEHTNHIFAVGVQWHPELMWEHDALHLKLFERLINCKSSVGG